MVQSSKALMILNGPMATPSSSVRVRRWREEARVGVQRAVLPTTMRPRSFPLICTGVGMNVPSSIEHEDSPHNATSGLAPTHT